MNRIQIHPSGWGFCEETTGAPFVPWGCNYYDPFTGWAPRLWEQFDPASVAQHFDQLQSIGANVIRVFTTLTNLLETPHQTRPQGLAKMERMLELAAARGLRVIWSGPSTWEGAPAWWREAAAYESFANPELITAVQTAWSAIAKAFRGHPALLAYELHNEPIAPFQPSPLLQSQWGRWRAAHAPEAPEQFPAPDEPLRLTWLPALQRFREQLAVHYVARMTEAIRAADDTHLITMGLHQKSAPFDWYPPDPYAAFNPHQLIEYLDYTSVHFYPHHIFHPNLYRDPYETPQGMRQTLLHARAVTRYMHAGKKPVVLEECGWYGGGTVYTAGREQPERSEEDQSAWCCGLTQATRNDVCGWLFWPYRDTPSSLDASRRSGLFDEAGRTKVWGRAFAELAPQITAALPTRAPATLRLPVGDCASSPEAVKQVRRAYLAAFDAGETVDFLFPVGATGGRPPRPRQQK